MGIASRPFGYDQSVVSVWLLGTPSFTHSSSPHVGAWLGGRKAIRQAMCMTCRRTLQVLLRNTDLGRPIRGTYTGGPRSLGITLDCRGRTFPRGPTPWLGLESALGRWSSGKCRLWEVEHFTGRLPHLR